MGLPAWPDLELAPLEESPLLQAARMRRFGVNYLQDGELLSRYVDYVLTVDGRDLGSYSLD